MNNAWVSISIGEHEIFGGCEATLLSGVTIPAGHPVRILHFIDVPWSQKPNVAVEVIGSGHVLDVAPNRLNLTVEQKIRNDVLFRRRHRATFATLTDPTR